MDIEIRCHNIQYHREHMPKHTWYKKCIYMVQLARDNTFVIYKLTAFGSLLSEDFQTDII